ncbi:MAG: fumarate hydratase [Euryarchaeota archaeon RBG_16_68_13]|nr:MAG: fumarate hydratase [Euryarchaeota archaeon RBG_16_68_13]
MRTVSVDRLGETVRDLYKEACVVVNPELERAYERARDSEPSPMGREILSSLIENVRLAARENLPTCQDTGIAIVFLEIGEEVRFDRAGILEAINDGVRAAWKEGYLRASLVKDPLRRGNTGDNTPAMVHLDLAPGDRVRIRVGAKGTGAENMSKTKIMSPSAGVEGAKQFLLETVKAAGPNACPPLVLGVGLGGNFEEVTLLAKKALYRDLGTPHPDPYYANLEREWLEAVNRLGVGPQGLGGRATALAVHIETKPCHIGALPIAVNIDCHAHRHKEAVL